jgi:uncharacterized protein
VLLVDVATIPEEGLELSEELTPASLALGAAEEVALEPGARFACRVERGDEGSVHVKGRLQARLKVDCGRCLEAFPVSLDNAPEVFFLPHREGDEREDEVELSEREMVIAYYRGRTIDLAEMLREELILAVPMRRLCREDCRGLCPLCGANRNRAGCDCEPEQQDPRLQPLARLLR